jgi:hypothetical protein
VLQAPKRGFLTTGKEIVKRETALGLYKGLGAVLTGIVPKMATRFTSYEWYKQMLADSAGNVNSKSTFMGELDGSPFLKMIMGAGTEGILEHALALYGHS